MVLGIRKKTMALEYIISFLEDCQDTPIQEILSEENYDVHAAAIYFQKQGCGVLPLYANDNFFMLWS